VILGLKMAQKSQKMLFFMFYVFLCVFTGVNGGLDPGKWVVGEKGHSKNTNKHEIKTFLAFFQKKPIFSDFFNIFQLFFLSLSLFQ